MGKPNIQRKIQNTMGNIVEHVFKKSYPCIVDGCTQTAINSHLLMVNGILNNAAEDGHLIEMSIPSPYSSAFMDFKSNRFKRLGIKQAFSLPIFCDQHDTALFSEIEQKEADYSNYKHLAIYTYRTICAEIRKKEQAHEINDRIIASKTLHELMPEDSFTGFKDSNVGLDKALTELKQYAQDLLEDINGNTEHYCFTAIEIPKMKVYAAGIPNLFSSDEYLRGKVLPIFIFIALPQANSTRIIMGYHKDYSYPEMGEYIDKWKNASLTGYGTLITGILIHMETWGMSPSLYDKLKPEKVQEYTNLFAASLLWSELPPVENLNLFEGVV